jgi:predicted lysophospholipase L1 biosynthesis ABC-type transport system permease subunit
MHILEGRGFEPSDKGHKPRPAVVSATFAQQFFPDVDPIGRTFGSGGVNAVTLPEYEIVAVVNDSKYRSMRETPPPTFYLLVDDDTLRFSDGMALYVTVRGDPSRFVHELQGMLREIGPGIAPTGIATMEQEIETSLWQERLLAALTSIFATLSAVLAGIGLFGMLAYGVSQRRREIGIRMSVGATMERIAKLIARDAAWTVVPGILGGLVAYAVCSRVLASLLYGVTRWDVVSVVGAVVFVIVASAVATIIPVLKATRIEPWQVLREE